MTDAVRSGFVPWFNDMDYATNPDPLSAFRAGRERAGHDASRVPETPPAPVESTVTDGEPAIAFPAGSSTATSRWSSCPNPPWARQVAGAGWAVVVGRPVVDVLEWDDSVTPARAARMRTALI